MTRRGVLALLVACSLGCSGGETRLVVVVDTDLAVPDELDIVRFDVEGPDDLSSQERVDLASEMDLPASLILTHEGGSLGPLTVTVVGSLGGADVVTRSARVSYVAGQTRVLRLDLWRECVGVACGAEETCAAGGCRAVDVSAEELLPWSGMPERVDARTDGVDACSPGPEECNGVDDDCDGTADEDFDLTSDLQNCGACGAACDVSSGVTGVTECASGSCRVTPCEGELRNCDLDAGNGCESDLRDSEHCGGCGIACDLLHAVASCGTGSCELISCEPGYDNCDGRSENGCEASVTDDIFHCGGCDRRCDGDPVNASDACESGMCSFLCDLGFADCNGIESDGCETDLSVPATCGGCGATCVSPDILCSGNPTAGFSCIVPPCVEPPTRCGDSCVDTTSHPLHCGGCGFACGTVAHSSPTCTGSVCGFSCDAGWGDCDLFVANGCETPLNTTSSCGGCGDVCAPANGVGACVALMCSVAACDPGYRDCNGLAGDGCEAELSTDPTACGGCGIACGGSMPACVGGVCAGCGPGRADCDGMTANGCETLLDTLTDCGGCGVTCELDRATESCATGSCTLVSCDLGYDDCDGMASSGCETPLDSLTDCGGCGVVCSRASAGATCAGGTCSLGACDAGFGDCDGMEATGCEESLETLTSCGGCGVTCDLANASESCGTGTCVLGACDTGFGDCDGVDPTGCEEDVTSSELHCGACGTMCAPTEICTLGVCSPSTAIVGLAAGGGHTCALRASGRAVCWGAGANGQLGVGSTSSATTPGAAVVGLTDAIQLNAGGSTLGLGTFGHVCEVRATGRVACWGSNGDGQLGDGFLSDRTTPVSVAGLTDAVHVSAGRAHTCAVRMGGTVVCWGDNDEGQLGDGTQTDRMVPVPVVGLSDAIRVSAGGRHTCALRFGGTVECWGNNTQGQVGDGSGMMRRTTPQPVPGLAGVVDVSLGLDHGCALDGVGALRCWGSNSFGQIGDGTTMNRDTPVTVSSSTTADAITTGGFFSCALLTGGGVECWGSNFFGQFGNGTRTDSSSPTPMSMVSDADLFVAGRRHVCLLRATGTVLCSGWNIAGQLGDGSMTDRDLPVSVMGLP